MTKASRTDWSQLARQEDKDIDLSDIPELEQDFFREAELRVPAEQGATSPA